jgi:hypothetical protein
MSKYGLYPGKSIPDPELLQLGVHFSTLEEFAVTAAKTKYAASG